MSATNRQFDHDGFLVEPGAWDRETAKEIAARFGIERLGDEHFAVIDAMRRHYHEHGSVPPPMLVCHDVGMQADCIDRLFGGPARAWKTAGLPPPGEEARVYLENQTPNN
jgi:tRNA 2-thiouridine synthesizing protein E